MLQYRLLPIIIRKLRGAIKVKKSGAIYGRQRISKPLKIWLAAMQNQRQINFLIRPGVRVLSIAPVLTSNRRKIFKRCAIQKVVSAPMPITTAAMHWRVLDNYRMRYLLTTMR